MLPIGLKVPVEFWHSLKEDVDQQSCLIASRNQILHILVPEKNAYVKVIVSELI
jgi:hypothetical protein